MIDINKTLKQRASTYGSFNNVSELSMSILKRLKSKRQMAYSRLNEIPPDIEFATLMIINKLSRLYCGDIQHIDSWTDIAGYATLIANRLDKLQDECDNEYD